MIKNILVAFDGSQKAYNAFEFALELTKVCSGISPNIVVLSVVQPPEPVDIVEMDAIIDSASQVYEKMFNDLRQKAKEKNIEIKTVIAVGHPADQIIRYASENNFDIIVMGQKGRS
ncbi:MAG: universal stress protein, partial [Thermodesulfovibrionales bacterium]|nr:universal stress protein [Thermodesulfovibrionales bacterium]